MSPLSMERAGNTLFFLVFFGLIGYSFWVCYEQLLVERHYQIFYTEDEADAANLGLYDVVKGKIYGTTP